MSRPTQFDKILKNAIAAMVRKGESITSIADAIGVSRQALYYHLGADEEFFDKIVDAREMVTDLVENAMLSRLWAARFLKSAQLNHQRGQISRL